MSLSTFLLCIAGLFVVSSLAVALRRIPGITSLVYAGVLAISSIIAALALWRIAAGAAPETLVLPFGIPWLGAHFRVDALSAFFLFVVNLGAAAASLFALGYGRHEDEPGRVLPFYALFIAFMNLVPIADDAFSFLLSWEGMSLSSWALVVARHRDPENRRAAFVYLVMASGGTLALLFAFGLLAGSQGSFDFSTIRETAQSPLIGALVLGLVLVGAGSKAGLVPLHAWLPLAHPAVPSHVSALMSGVMTKVAVYGFIRIIFDLLGSTSSWWWATVVLIVGGITAAMGVLYALMQHDLKRLLAYHTVENIGIIFIGLGLALAFRSNGFDLAAALALTAALFHVFNHSVFKSLLFFGSGAVLSATGERDMEQLGGLIHQMPATALFFLIGCAAISALPPLNGFVSEWLTFQAILLSPDLPQWDLRIVVPAVGTLLALSAALAAACFVKAFGITFLGRARSEAARQASETDGMSLTAMGLFAVLCILAGILPGLVVDFVGNVTREVLGANLLPQGLGWPGLTPISAARSSYNSILVLALIAVSIGLAWLLASRAGLGPTRRAPAWDCGFPEPSAATQYSATSFAQPIRRTFGTVLFRVRETVDMPAPLDTRAAKFQVIVRDLIWEWLYLPTADLVERISDRLNPFQFLTIRRYLGLVFALLVALLMLLAVWQ